CSRFYVAWPQEGASLRRQLGPAPDILVFHGVTGGTLDLFQMYQLQPVLNHLEQIDLWLISNVAPRPAAIHVDTGMNRLGLSEAHWAAAARMLPKPTRLISHLACGDETSDANQAQLARFDKASTLWPGIPRSLSATGGAYLGRGYHLDEVRPGIGLYGGGPTPAEGSTPHTVVTLTAPILQVRDVKQGDTVGYGCAWTAPADTQTATIGLGYADGYLRSASNKAHVFVQLQCGFEPIARTCLETKARVASTFCNGNDVRKNGTSRALTAQGIRRAHGLYFAVRRVELTKCAATQQRTVLPRSPEGDVRDPQLGDIQRMHTGRRRQFVHVGQMFAQ
ncbi:MAG: alanine racemase, partial [Phycisphaerae bacterium]|nr:alanine racemase [Gemmatimonadaceae bacterium]